MELRLVDRFTPPEDLDAQVELLRFLAEYPSAANGLSRTEELALAYPARVDRLVRDLRSGERMPGVERIWMPGEQSHAKRVERSELRYPRIPQLAKIR